MGAIIIFGLAFLAIMGFQASSERAKAFSALIIATLFIVLFGGLLGGMANTGRPPKHPFIQSLEDKDFFNKK